MLHSLRRSSFLAAVAIAIGLGSAPVIAQQPTMTSAAPRQARVGKRGLFGSVRASTGYGRKGAGVSMAAQQRASRKARNVARSKRR